MAAASEERFSRQKHDPRLPVEAFRFCLESAGLDPHELDAVAYYEDPTTKLSRQLWARRRGQELAWLDSGHPERLIRERLGYEGKLFTYQHHLSHAASSFYFSEFDRAALLTADSVGEWATTTYGQGRGSTIDLFEEVRFPHSLGLLYSTITAYLGFRVNGGEYKVMGLAPYGEPRFLDEVCQLIGMGPEGQFLLNLRYFDFVRGERMYSDALCELFGQPPREPESEIEPFHQDVARSLQLLLEEILLEKAAWLRRKTDLPNLCLAGGVALNCVANGRLLRESFFEQLFIQPAAGDAGGALGAAALAAIELGGQRPEPLQHVYLGPQFSSDDTARLLARTGLEYADFRHDEPGLIAATIKRLQEGKVVGWFHGAMEFGPRALGGRSILADPRRADMRERLNRLVKKREMFRPFAPSVLRSEATSHFALDHPSPYMLETCQVRSALELPAITHVNGSARPQTVDERVNPRFARLIAAFASSTGCPILVNTSFNVRGEPIVCTPSDALFCFGSSGIDCLVLEDCLVDREALPENWPDLFASWQRGGTSSAKAAGEKGKQSAISETLYTFV